MELRQERERFLVQRPSCAAKRLRGGNKSSAGNGGDRLVVAALVSVGLSLEVQSATIPDVKHADLGQSECTLNGGNFRECIHFDIVCRRLAA